MRKLVGDEWKDFVLAEPRPAICAIVLSDGRPHATPIWIDLDGDEVVFTTWHEGVKAHVLTREPRLSLCVQDDQPPFAFVSIQGIADVIDDVEAVKVWAAPSVPRSTAGRTASPVSWSCGCDPPRWLASSRWPGPPPRPERSVRLR
jgi:PPOX class probable F420-dependent enzyme